MKRLLLALLLALAALPVEAVIPYQAGDLFLGFRASGGTGQAQDYLVNIGPASSYTGAPGSAISATVGNIAADLALVFGPDWYTRADLFWSISGTAVSSDPEETLYASRARVLPGTQGLPWKRRSPSCSQGVTTSTFNSLSNGFINSTASAANARATIQNAGGINSYASFQPGGTPQNSGGISFAAFNPTIEGNFANGAARSVLDLVKLVPSTTPDLDGLITGSFTLDTAGNLIYTPAGQTSLTTIRLEQATASVTESTTGNATVSLKVLRGGNIASAFSAKLNTADGTATVVNGDYVAATNVDVAFAAGADEATVELSIPNRAGFQGSRTFTATVSGAGATFVTPATATITILEGEQNDRGALSFSAAAYNAASVTASGAPNTVNVVVNRANGAQGSVTVEVTVTGGTLAVGTGYTALANPTTLTFGPGVTTRSVTINLLPLTEAQLTPPKTILLALANPTNLAVLGAQTTATVTVTYQRTLGTPGSYTGILVPTTAGAQPGLVTLTLTPARGFTGKVSVGAVSKSISGKLDASGNALFKPANGASLTIANLGTITLQLDGPRLTGTLSNGAAPIATVQASRAFFTGKTPATSVNPAYLVNKGLYTMILPARATQTNLAPSAYPQGDGYGQVTLKKTGVITFKGKLADGSVISTGGKLTENYQWQLFLPLYAKKGSLSGTVTFDNTQTESDLSGANLNWFRPADPRPAVKYYREGWPAGILVDLLGANFDLTPGSTVPTSVFPGLDDIGTADGNATLTFTDGKLTGPVTKTVDIRTNNTVLRAPADASFTLKIVKGTGAFSGKFPHTDLKKPAYQGVIYQKGQNPGGYGYFLSLPELGSTGESGAVTLKAQPPTP